MLFPEITLLSSLASFPSLPPTFLGKYSFHTLVSQSCLLTVPGGGLWLGFIGDLLAAEEFAALLCCYLYGTYSSILQLA